MNQWSVQELFLRDQLVSHSDEYLPIHLRYRAQLFFLVRRCTPSRKKWWGKWQKLLAKLISVITILTCLHRREQGTFLVTKNCFLGGKYGFALLSSPHAHCQVGQWWTRWSPATTNSSGVMTPVSRNLDS